MLILLLFIIVAGVIAAPVLKAALAVLAVYVQMVCAIAAALATLYLFFKIVAWYKQFKDDLDQNPSAA